MEDGAALETIIPRRPFSNAGNSCYVNAIVQALFAAGAIQRELSNFELMLSPSDKALCALYIECISQLLEESVHPSAILRSFHNGLQRDAEEFLHEVVQPASAPTVCGLCTTKLKSRIMCAECPGVAHMTESGEEILLCLSLPVRRAVDGLVLSTVQDCLYHFEQPEVLTDYMWCCESCNSTLSPTKMVSYVKLPEVLLLQLKRWRGVGYMRPVDFPIYPMSASKSESMSTHYQVSCFTSARLHLLGITSLW